MNRRELLKGLMAGGVIIAGELWIPGKKLISIPNYNFSPTILLLEQTPIGWRIVSQNSTCTEWEVVYA